LIIDPQCKQLIQDFERVRWAADANGNILPDIDKSDPMRTHVSDALGYKLAYESELMEKGRALPNSIF
jgi:phage terminase large subunit